MNNYQSATVSHFDDLSDAKERAAHNLERQLKTASDIKKFSDINEKIVERIDQMNAAIAILQAGMINFTAMSTTDPVDQERAELMALRALYQTERK